MANSTIKHKFTSAKADSTDPTLVNPSNWNDTHNISTPDGIPSTKQGVILGTDNSGVLDINGLASATALAFLRRNAANSAYEFAAFANGIQDIEGAVINALSTSTPLNYLRRNAGNTAYEFGALPAFPVTNYPDGILSSLSNALTGTPATALLQKLRRNLLNTAYEFVNDRVTYLADDYDFAAQQPGGSLVVGSNTILMNPMPPGVNSTDSGHYLYISGGTGTAESCLITGGDATHLIVTCAFTHSGAWTIRSVSNGISEAVQALKTDTSGAGGTVTVKSFSTYTIHGQVTWPAGGSWVLQGNNPWLQNITRASDYPNGHMFYSTTGYISYLNVGINGNLAGSQSAGACIYGRADTITNCFITAGYYGVYLYGSAGNICNNFFQGGTHTTYNIVIDGGCTDVNIVGGQLFAASITFGVLIKWADGVNIVGVMGGAGGSTGWLDINPTAGHNVVDVHVIGCLIDQATDNGIRILTSGVTAQVSGVDVIGCTFLGGPGSGSPGMQYGGMNIGASGGAGLIQYIRVSNCSFVYCKGSCITVHSITNPSRISISDCKGYVSVNGLELLGVNDVRVSNCDFTENTGYGILETYAGDIYSIRGGSLNGNTLGPILLVVTTHNNIIFEGVQGVMDIAFTTIASASSINPPVTLAPVFKVSGTTTILTITAGWIGRRVRIISTSGTITIGGGGNIPLAHSVVQNNALDLVFDGTNWY